VPLYDVRCPQGHEAERWAKWDERSVPCQTCGAPTDRIWRANAGSKAPDVTWPGGKTFENGFPEPRTFYSPTEYRRALGERGLQVRGDGEERFTPMSKEGLKKAEALMERMYPCQ
jgi:hypothetical protein